MRYEITDIAKGASKYVDDDAVGKVHLSGAFDSFACGLADEEYVAKETSKPITCSTCLTFLSWARKAARLNKQKI